MSYAVRVEYHGDLLREVACADFADAVETALRLAAEYASRRAIDVRPCRPDNVDLGMPDGLSTDERATWLEVAP